MTLNRPNLDKLRMCEVRSEVKQNMDNNLNDPQLADEIEGRREALKKVAHDTAEEVLDKPDRKHQDWFRDENEYLNRLIEE